VFHLDVVHTDTGMYTASITVTRDDGDPPLFERGYLDFPAFDTEASAKAWAIGTAEAFVAELLGAPPLR